MHTLTDTRPWEIPDEYSLKQGKVRDIYDFGGELCMIATDRLSAFDVILEESPIPGRGIVLNQMTLHWLDALKSIPAIMHSDIPVTSQVVSTNVADLPEAFHPFADELEGRFMLVRKCLTPPIEAIVRGYISGSMFKEVTKLKESATGDSVLWRGHEIPTHLVESQQLPNPLFTPSTKAELGQHDANISYDEMVEILRTWLREQGISLNAEVLAADIRHISLGAYVAGNDYARQHNIIIADTKFEFGLLQIDGVWHLVIIDEVLTPDSSRFWPANEYEPGRSQNSADKQIVRDYLAKVLGWNKQSPAPVLPHRVIAQTAYRYREVANDLEVTLPPQKRHIAILLGSESDWTDEIKSAVEDMADQLLPTGEIGKITVVQNFSCDRRKDKIHELTAGKVFDDGEEFLFETGSVDVFICGAGMSARLGGDVYSELAEAGYAIPIIPVGFGTPGTENYQAARLAHVCIPGKPLILDPSGDSYMNAEGMRAALKRAATEVLPLPKPPTKKTLKSQCYAK